METCRLRPDEVEILTAAAEAWDRKEDARQLIAEGGWSLATAPDFRSRIPRCRSRVRPPTAWLG
jgi:hypothetical protein